MLLPDERESNAQVTEPSLHRRASLRLRPSIQDIATHIMPTNAVPSQSRKRRVAEKQARLRGSGMGADVCRSAVVVGLDASSLVIRDRLYGRKWGLRVAIIDPWLLQKGGFRLFLSRSAQVCPFPCTFESILQQLKSKWALHRSTSFLSR